MAPQERCLRWNGTHKHPGDGILQDLIVRSYKWIQVVWVGDGLTNNPIKHSFHWPGACLGTLAKAVTYATSCKCCIRLRPSRPSRFDVWTVKNSVSINFYILHLSIFYHIFPSAACWLSELERELTVLDPESHRMPSLSLWSDELTVQIQQGPKKGIPSNEISGFYDPLYYNSTQ